MVPCFAIDNIITPKKFVLRGLWLGPKKPKRVIIFIHGLGGSMWSRFESLQRLADKNTAVLTFNNRGHDKVAFVARAGKNRHTTIPGGAAHEVFTDCVDDIQGAINFVRKQKVKNVFLAGHSTGCQKSVYWTYRKKGKGVKGIILLAPVSDYAAALQSEGGAKIIRAERVARALVKKGKKHDMVPGKEWPSLMMGDAQRFLSLYTPDSIEEIFSYAQPNKNPRILKSIRVPTLVLWAEHDEYADRPAKQAVAWFEKNMEHKHKIVIVPGVKHSFKGGEKKVANEIRTFISG